MQPQVCWNSCDDSQTGQGDDQRRRRRGRHGAGHAVADAGHAGQRSARSRRASPRTTPPPRRRNVISSAGDGALSVADPSSNATGRLVNGTFSLPSALQAKASSTAGTGGALANVGGSAAPTTLLTYTGPTSNDAVALAFQQHIGAD